ncbi:hypothetical protein [Burkholderia sp.]|uniref:hypothetical protein n=1 Tax=Burkholderia sp. TaxID=36773 RepID=UPI00283AB628|nr:hypothetical protein [Burkholderia sp.]
MPNMPALWYETLLESRVTRCVCNFGRALLLGARECFTGPVRLVCTGGVLLVAGSMYDDRIFVENVSRPNDAGALLAASGAAISLALIAARFWLRTLTLNARIRQLAAAIEDHGSTHCPIRRSSVADRQWRDWHEQLTTPIASTRSA